MNPRSLHEREPLSARTVSATIAAIGASDSVEPTGKVEGGDRSQPQALEGTGRS
jgi:hypothetical protein